VILNLNPDAKGIYLKSTNGAFIRDFYCEGAVAQRNEAIAVDGCNASNLFTDIQNAVLNHVKKGLRLLPTTGSQNSDDGANAERERLL